MSELSPVYNSLLPRVAMPGQYVGGEFNAVVKPAAQLRVALAFPEPYTIGMSHHGTRIFYESLNALEGIAAERAFVPMPDMEAELRKANEPLRTLETFTQLADCDMIAVSLQHELTATGLLTLLDLGGVPLLRENRGDSHPLILAGGHTTMNPEPLSDFVDLFFIGEGDEGVLEIAQILLEMKDATRQAKIARLAKEVAGVYAPSLYSTETRAGGAIFVTEPCGDAPAQVERRIFRDFAKTPNPRKPIVPVVESVHERITLEILRGCPNGCRFCQAGMICRPVRQRPIELLAEDAAVCYANTGYDEVGLLSLSTSDYTDFNGLVETLDKEFAPKGVSLSLPSLRVDDALSDIPKRFKSVRKSGLTIAPEAGSDRLRAAINKDVTRENLLTATAEAYAQGWHTIKLYFMIGLPTETDEDVAAIAHLSMEVASQRRKKGRGPAVTCSVSNFVPKPHTPFQWEAMDTAEEFARKQALIESLLDHKRISFKGHDPQTSRLEGIFARGDRRLGKVILEAWQRGARLDAWGDYFRPTLWEEAFAETGLGHLLTSSGERATDAPLAWQHIGSGLQESFFLRERSRCYETIATPKCAPKACAGCNVPGCLIHNTPA